MPNLELQVVMVNLFKPLSSGKHLQTPFGARTHPWYCIRVSSYAWQLQGSVFRRQSSTKKGWNSLGGSHPVSTPFDSFERYPAHPKKAPELLRSPNSHWKSSWASQGRTRSPWKIEGIEGLHFDHRLLNFVLVTSCHLPQSVVIWPWISMIGFQVMGPSRKWLPGLESQVKRLSWRETVVELQLGTAKSPVYFWTCICSWELGMRCEVISIFMVSKFAILQLGTGEPMEPSLSFWCFKRSHWQDEIYN